MNAIGPRCAHLIKKLTKSHPLMFTPGIIEALLMNLIMAAGAIIHCSVGFGLALIAVPLLLMVRPEAVPGPVVFTVFVLSILISRSRLRFIDFSGLKFALIGRFPGAFAGAFAISVLPIKYLSVILGTLVLIAVGFSLIKKDLNQLPSLCCLQVLFLAS